MTFLNRIVILLSAIFIISGPAMAADIADQCMVEIIEEIQEIAPVDDNCSVSMVPFDFFRSGEQMWDSITKDTEFRELSRKKKKVKRYNSWYGTRPVVKDSSRPEGFMQYGYKRPYFIHHLHQFLFRLTPF